MKDTLITLAVQLPDDAEQEHADEVALKIRDLALGPIGNPEGKPYGSLRSVVFREDQGDNPDSTLGALVDIAHDTLEQALAELGVHLFMAITMLHVDVETAAKVLSGPNATVGARVQAENGSSAAEDQEEMSRFAIAAVSQFTGMQLVPLPPPPHHN